MSSLAFSRRIRGDAKEVEVGSFFRFLLQKSECRKLVLNFSRNEGS